MSAGYDPAGAPAYVRWTSDSDHWLGAPLRAIRDLTPCSKKHSLFDHLVGAQHEAGRDLMADRLRGLEIDDQLEPRRLLDWQIRRLDAAQQLGELAAHDDRPAPPFPATGTRRAGAASQRGQK